MLKQINLVNITSGWKYKIVDRIENLSNEKKGFKPAIIGNTLEKKVKTIILNRTFSVPDFSQRRSFIEFSTPCDEVRVWIDGKEEKVFRQGEKTRIYSVNIIPGRRHILTIGLKGRDIVINSPIIVEQSIEICEDQEYMEPLVRGSDRYFGVRVDNIENDPFAARRYMDIHGIPFKVADWQKHLPSKPMVGPCGFIPRELVTMKKAKDIPVGTSASSIYFLGMVSSYDCGTGSWYHKSNDTSQEQFIGDCLGEIIILYRDKSKDIIPLIFGFTVLWFTPFNAGVKRFEGGIRHSGPFDRDKNALQDLNRCLFLNNAYPEDKFAFILKYKPRKERIEKILIRPNRKMLGSPLIGGITIETRCPSRSLDVLPNFPRGLKRWKSLTRKDLNRNIIDTRIKKLQHHLYTFETDIRSKFPVEIPPKFKGPKIRFNGNQYADMLTNIYHHSLDITAKMVADDGTSTVASNNSLPRWGAYRYAVGCYTRPTTKEFPKHYPPAGSNIWSRDVGRAVSELVKFGFHNKGMAAVDFWDKNIDLCKPSHWTRYWGHHCINMRMETLDGTVYKGQPENNGHGLLTLARYQVWNSIARDLQWLENHWEVTKKAVEWIVWQLKHPTVCDQPNGTIFTTGEVGTGWHDIYTNSVCFRALCASIEMASALGKTIECERWSSYAGFMKDAMKRYFIENNGASQTWKFIYTDDRYQRYTDWRAYGQSLGPLIIAADIVGYDQKEMEQWLLDISRNTFLKRLTEAIPPYNFAGSFGYGQAFITQAALLLDEIKHAEKLINAVSKYIYFSKVMPWVVPEGTAVHPSGKYWYRVGMFANQVQIAEVLKIIRIMIGVDYSNPHHLKIIPRIPESWEGLRIENLPVTTNSSGKLCSFPIKYNYTISSNRGKIELTAGKIIDSISFRLGPISKKVMQIHCNINGKKIITPVTKSGDSYWIWVTKLKKIKKVTISFTY